MSEINNSLHEITFGIILITMIITILILLFIWLFIRSAVESGTKRAIMNCYYKILDIEEEAEAMEEELFHNFEDNQQNECS